jgi:hypothetical protein
MVNFLLEPIFSWKISSFGDRLLAFEQTALALLPKLPLKYAQNIIKFYLHEVNPSYKIEERLTPKQLILYWLKK